MRPLTRPLPDRWTVIGGIRRSLWQQITPPQLFVGSFALLILIGTVGFQVLTESLSQLVAGRDEDLARAAKDD